ncbi:MAG: glycosyltransferase [Alistipes sp.]
MKPIRVINVFTSGNSADMSVWSNIPYLLCQTLERKGYTVNRINYASMRNPYIEKFIWLCDFIYRHIDRKHGKGYLYAKLYYACVDRKIARAAAKYPADLNICPYNCRNHCSTQPTLLLGDWTQEYLYRTRLKTEPQGFQKFYAKRQDEIIEQSDFVVSLFPVCAADMQAHYHNPHIFYLGQNVVNNVCDTPLDEETICRQKGRSHKILFVGKIHYIEAARQLIGIFDRLTAVYPDAELDIIGLTRQELGDTLPERIRCHGYLNKSRVQERVLYYRMMSEASLFVNTTPLWGGYSSTIEAMYFYTPIIISPYGDFTTEFGTQIPFGNYCNQLDADALFRSVCEVFDTGDYRAKCLAAHAAVEKYTWDNYVDRLLAVVEQA